MKTTSAHDSGRTPAAGASGPRHTVLNWVLAIVTVFASLAVVTFAYLQVLGTAGCSGGTCAETGPNETVFGLIIYGIPVLAVVVVALSVVTARRRWGVVVPGVALLLLAIAVLILVTTF